MPNDTVTLPTVEDAEWIATSTTSFEVRATLRRPDGNLARGYVYLTPEGGIERIWVTRFDTAHEITSLIEPWRAIMIKNQALQTLGGAARASEAYGSGDIG